MTDKFREIIPISFLIQRTATEEKTENENSPKPTTTIQQQFAFIKAESKRQRSYTFFSFKLLTAWSHWVLFPSLLLSSASSIPPLSCQIHRKGERSTGRGSAPWPESPFSTCSIRAMPSLRCSGGSPLPHDNQKPTPSLLVNRRDLWSFARLPHRLEMRIY